MKWRLKGQQKRSIKLGDFFKKTNKIDKTLATFAKNKKKGGENKIRNKRENIKTNITEI